MGHTNDRSTKATSLVNPTSLNLQPRPFAPLESDEKEEAVSRKSGYSENFLEKIINTPSSESAMPVQRKSGNPLKAIATERTNTAIQNQPIQRQEAVEEEKSEGEQEDTKEFTMNPEPPPVQRKFENRLRAKNAQKMAIQAKLAIGEPNDKYEQEADANAARVVEQINSSIPSQSQPIQRQEMEEDEELQMKPFVQRSENIGGGQASTDLESAIQSARGSGQSLDANLQESMGQAMGADFSGVKVHTDSQSDQLNKSIQAKAFTTGQDLFFRQGAYEPSSRGGQELIAHELTHVVQQNGGAVQRSSQPTQGQIVNQDLSNAPIQRKIGFEYEMSTVYSALATPVTEKEKKEFAKQIDLAGKGKKIKTDFTSETDMQRRNYLGSGELIDNDTGEDMEGNAQEKMGQYRFHALSKKEKIVRGPGYTLEADEGNAMPDGSGMSNTEFVTDAFDENNSGLDALRNALIDFIEITKRIQSFDGKRKVVHATEIAPNGGMVGKVIYPTKNVGGALQMTGAIKLSQIPELMKSMNAGTEESPETKTRMKNVRDMLGPALGGSGAPSGPTGNAPNNAEKAIENSIDWAVVPPPKSFGSKELKGLFSLIASYMMSANSSNIGYAKTIAPVMARTNFAAMFTLIKPEEQEYLKNNEHDLLNIVKEATNELDLNADVFPEGIYNDPRAQGGGEKDALKGLTRKKWILGIVNGIDYLTKAKFNQNPDLNVVNPDQEKGDLESMGALGEKMEEVGPSNKRELAPIFEIRSLGQLATPEQLFDRAMQLFNYIVLLNKEGIL